jgi:hypothetical protein
MVAAAADDEGLHKENPKSGIRMPKEIRMPNAEGNPSMSTRRCKFRPRGFGFRVSGFFRISPFGFRISG